MKTWPLVMALALIFSCVTNPSTGQRELNRDLVHAELMALTVDAENYAALIEPEKPEAAELARSVSEALRFVDDAIVAGQTGDDLLTTLRAAVDLVPEVVAVFDDDPDRQRELRLIVFAVRTVLNHAIVLLDVRALDDPAPPVEPPA